MKKVLFSLFLLMQGISLSYGATVYEWKDSKGVLHFTDDPKKVPEKYRDEVRERDLGPTEQPRQAPAPQPLPAVQGKVSGDSYSGRTGLWWRNRFDTLRSQLAALQQGLTAKHEKLSDLRRQHLIFQRSRDRAAANEVAAAIDRDETQIKEIQGALAALQQEADRAGVPAEWR